MSDAIEPRIFRPSFIEDRSDWVVVEEGHARSWELGQSMIRSPDRRRGDPWEVVPVDIVPARKRSREPGQSLVPWFSRQVLILRGRAIDSLGELLEPEGELLPLIAGGERLVMFTTAPTSTDAIIEEKSDLPRVPPWSPDFQIEGICLDASQIGSRRAFEINTGRSYTLLLRGDLVDEMRATGDVTGIRLDDVGSVVT